MKVFAISDLHLAISANKPMDVFGGAWENYLPKIKADWNNKVSDDDVVIVAGDISWAMKLSQFESDLSFFDGLKGKIVFIRGNHDYWWNSLSKVRGVLRPNMYALQNDSIKINNVIFCGTRGWELPNSSSTEQDKMLYAREKIRLSLALESVKPLRQNNEKLVAIVHYPPYTPQNKDNDFVKMFEQYNVNAVVFGHLHNEFTGLKLVYDINNIKYYLTSCDLLNNSLAEIML